MKKILTLAMVLLMVMSMTTTAFAAETGGSITIEDSVLNKTYEFYKIFDLTYDTVNTANVAYTIDSDWTAFFAGSGSGYIVDSDASAALNKIVVDGAEKYINITDSNVAAFADAALAYAVTLTPDKSVTGTGSDLTTEGLALGYYLVYPKAATDVKDSYACICALDSTNPNASVVIKAEYPTIQKQGYEGSVDVGCAIQYVITGKVPDTTGFTSYIYTIKDTMTAGLTYLYDAVVTVEGMTAALVKDTHYTITETDRGFVLTIFVMDLQSYVDKTITVSYFAQANEAAVENTQNNCANLTYSNDPSDEESTETTPDVRKYAYSSKITITKVDSTDETVLLKGAEFVLMRTDDAGSWYYCLANGCVSWVADQEDATVVTTGNDGTAVFAGLANGTYELEEIKAPDGYNLMADTQQVVVQGDDNEYKGVNVPATVKNNTGSLLPSTGGMGTTVFYVLGSAMVLCAIVLLVAKQRKDRKDT